MSLLALVGGQKMRAFKGGRGECDFCGAQMRAKCGEIVTHHWAHEPRAECDSWFAKETPWHLMWKDRFLRAGARVEVPMERNGERHRADVVLPHGGVVELAGTYHSAQAIEAREAFYEDLIWLYNTDRFVGRIVALLDGLTRDQTMHDLARRFEVKERLERLYWSGLLSWKERQDIKAIAQRNAWALNAKLWEENAHRLTFWWKNAAESVLTHRAPLFWHHTALDVVASIQLSRSRSQVRGRRTSDWCPSEDFISACISDPITATRKEAA